MRFAPQRLAQHKADQWRALHPTLARTPAVAALAGQALETFPVINPMEMRTDYGRWNSLGLSDMQLREMADLAEQGDSQGSIAVGWSTGSGGGVRGLFVADQYERADYIGQSLARLLPPHALLKHQRVALLLRANSKLYSDVKGRRIGFLHIPLDHSFDQVQAALNGFDPTVLIAPPSHLIDLAISGIHLPNLTHLFYASEPMSALEVHLVTERLGHRPLAIYQATEGFLGASCIYGRLHLNDHALEIEAEPVIGTPGFRPIITDFRRRSQPIVRLRGDDYLEFDQAGECECGHSGRTIRPVAGRVGDIWHFFDRNVTPAEVTRIIEGVLGAETAWQACATPSGVILRAAASCPAERLVNAADRLAQTVGQTVRVAPEPITWCQHKRRKVVWQHE